MPGSASTFKGLFIFDQTALTTYYTSTTRSHKASDNHIDAKRTIQIRSAPGLPNIGFQTSTLTKRSPVGTVTSIKSDAEPVLPHAAETAQNLQEMADQVHPNLAIDSI